MLTLTVYQASIWLCIMHQWLYANANCASGVNMAVYHALIWLNAVYDTPKMAKLIFTQNLHQYGSVLCFTSKLWFNPVHHGSMHASHSSAAQCYIRHYYVAQCWRASCINMAVHHALIIIITQCCASGSNVAVHYASKLPSIWPSTVHHIKIMAQSCAPWLNAVHPWLIDVHQASVWLNAIICIKHQYCSILCIRHQYGSMVCFTHQLYLSAVLQASM